jgi:hypothetical protein
MVTKPTGNRPGRPRVSLRDDPLRFDMALAEAIRRGLKVPAQKAVELAVLEYRAEKMDFVGEFSSRMRRILEQAGGEIVSYDISMLRGGRDEEFECDPSKRIQLINTLQKKLKRGIAEEDKEYFTMLGACYYAALFGKGSLERRAIGIELLSKEIGEDANIGAAMAAAVRKVAQVVITESDATSDIPEFRPVGATTK